LIGRDIDLARALQQRNSAREEFELVAAGPLSVTCFRYIAPGIDDLDALNRQLLDTVQREGQVFLTSTQLDGKLVLRTCIVNFRTQEADLDFLLAVLAKAGRRVERLNVQRSNV
jgi:glutamate/tyrosine decarboxylase-like PLP-dependent enzyme